MTLSLKGCVTFTSLQTLSHTYAQAGNYSISVIASNSVSNRSYSFTHSVIEVPSSPQFVNLPSVLPFPYPNSSIIFYFTFGTGTNLYLQSNLSQTPGTVEYTQFNHSGNIQFPANAVNYPGDYVLSLSYDTTITNSQSISAIVEVDALIPSPILCGDQFALIPTADPNPSNHYVNLKFALCYLNGSIIPFRQDMSFDYGDGHSYSISNYSCNASAADPKMPCSNGYIFCTGIPYNTYSTLGNLTASATLSNLRNQVNVSFTFFIYSQIHNLTDSLYVIPFGVTQSAPNPSNYWPLMNIPYYPLENPIWFVSTLQFGTETPVIYWWDFGDGSFNITSIPYISHQYMNPGTYRISLNTSNPVSNEQTGTIQNHLKTDVNQSTVIIVQRSY